MQVTLETLQQQAFKIKINPEGTVKTLKEKIESQKGKDAFPVANQKLIYAGKILNDEAALKEYKRDEKNFVVVMVTKPKAVTTRAPATTQQSNPTTTPIMSSSTAPAVTQAPTLTPASTTPHLLHLHVLVQQIKKNLHKRQQKHQWLIAQHQPTVHQEMLLCQTSLKMQQVHL
ncbi:hypothetical protein MC885_001745 [Smutsia gigantea]|nr:hypothetical protein MC885_001745 [Smutsia gigantea]